MEYLEPAYQFPLGDGWFDFLITPVLSDLEMMQCRLEWFVSMYCTHAILSDKSVLSENLGIPVNEIRTGK